MGPSEGVHGSCRRLVRSLNEPVKLSTRVMMPVEAMEDMIRSRARRKMFEMSMIYSSQW